MRCKMEDKGKRLTQSRCIDSFRISVTMKGKKRKRGDRMKVRYDGESDPEALKNGKVYEVLSVEHGWYRIADESGEQCLYPPDIFETLEPKKQK